MAPGRGSTFTLELPLAGVVSARPGPPAARSRGSTTVA
jgi:hypothetical protein